MAVLKLLVEVGFADGRVLQLVDFFKKSAEYQDIVHRQ